MQRSLLALLLTGCAQDFSLNQMGKYPAAGDDTGYEIAEESEELPATEEVEEEDSWEEPNN